MKATTRLCPIVLLICAARLVCTAQQQRYNHNNGVAGYPLDYADAKLIQEDYLLEKRNKPSLSIVNPLDVLRQRLLLEIARRQMKENTRQVELNRAILKNVGKRMLSTGAGDFNYKLPAHTQEQLEYLLTHIPYRQQLYSYYHGAQHPQLQQLWQPQYTNQLEYAPDVSVSEYLQRPAYTYEATLGATALAGSESKAEVDSQTPLYLNALESTAGEGEVNIYKANGNDMTADNKAPESHSQRAGVSSDAGALANNGLVAKNLSGNEQPAVKDANQLVDGEGVDGNDGNADYRLRYFYGLRKKHHSMRK
ncbi:uncharacterized protein LOC101456921 [Ceratitis capitata]|uniref:uncharacterized protein LOC101456921 n=1 Tax=Ceratitis capitata TaxID=7213 RepID=UPI000329BEA3|nr:uncharacterized protein LOC101456921 [Ceratitis capitata]